MYLNNWLLVFILVTLNTINPITSFVNLATFCSNDTMFGNNSAYNTNLNTLFRSMSTNATNNPSGFYQNTVVTHNSETIYGHYLCRGDQNTTSCHECVTSATTTDLPNRCPNRKVAIVWYDECMVRYSNDSFFRRRDQSPPLIYWSANPIIGNATNFMKTLGNMITNVIANRAAEGGSLKKFATDFANISVIQPIYVLGQCTPDLTPFDCFMCLNSSITSFRQTPGGRVFTPSCVVRYEAYEFFDLSYLPSPSPSPSQPPTRLSPPSDNGLYPIIRSRGSRGRNKLYKTVLVPIIAALLFIIATVFWIYTSVLKKKEGKVYVSTNTESSDQDLTVDSLQYDLATLVTATNNFSDGNKIGEGGFGSVYKGMLSNGQLIAVKRLSASSSQGIQEFKTEVLLVAKLQHRNLVRLLGFCYTKEEQLLVYEYLANKSLDNFLFDDENRRQLDWQRRYNIIRGIARGLLYLHHDSRLRIIHRDLKASNILLGDDMKPKISDFGTSRIFGVDHTNSTYTNRIVGTYGYMAPEYALQGQFSIKSDAYSFGVLVLEIMSGRRNGIVNQQGDATDLLSHVWKKWEAGTPLECVDPIIRDSCSTNSEAVRCIHLGLLCVQESVEDRPTMANVTLTLDSSTFTLPIPQQPALFVPSRVESKLSNGIGSIHSSNKPKLLSFNDITISETEPR